MRFVPIVALLAPIALASSSAYAEPTKEDLAKADALFKEGRAMLAAGKLPAACEKLDASYRLAPGLGTLINLGACHERSGKTGRAYGVYKRASRIAREAGRFDREKEANERIAVLESKIGRVHLPPRIDDRETTLLCDGATIEPFEPGIAALEPGKHECKIEADAKVKWSGSITLVDGETKTIEITPPAPPPPSSPSAPPHETAPPPSPPPPAEKGNTTTIAGWALLGVGTLALGTAGFFAIRAKSKDDEAGTHCDARGCDPEGVALGSDAMSAGNVATGFAIAGLALAAGGAVMLLLLRPSSATASRVPAATFTF